MYIVINKTLNTTKRYKGNWPDHHLLPLLNDGNDVIVISLYSNTIKVPFSTEQYGEKEWEWTDYPLPIDLIPKS
jgi:hypothetical protein